MQPEPGKAEIDRQGPLDLVAAVIEQFALVGHRRRDAVAQDVHRHRALIEKAEMEQLHPVLAAAGPEKGALGPEADIPVIVEAERVERFREVGRAPPRRGRRRAPAPGEPHPRN